MANALLDAIEDGIKANKPLIWLEAEEYGAEVVRNGKPFPWTNPTEFVSSYGQLQNLLKPGVAPVNIGNFLMNWLEENPTGLNEMSGKKRIRFALKRLLGMEAPRKVIRDIVSALCESVSQPIVLVLPENGTLINWANQRANGVGKAEITDIDVDSVSVYIADFLRAFSGLNIAGVVVQLPNGCAVNEQLLELYSPIINVSKHYHWAFGVQVAKPEEINDQESIIDIILSEHSNANSIQLDETFWKNGKFDKANNGFYYAHVHAQLNPETVLERLANLHA